MRNILLLILVLFCWNTALAQDEAVPTDSPDETAQATDESTETDQTSADEPGSGLTFDDYSAEEFGLTIPIPTVGDLQTPGEYGWSQEPEVVFVWRGDKDSPVSMIELRADNIGTSITPDQYEFFYDKLVSEWEGQPNQFKVLRSRTEPYRFGDMDWLIIEVEDSSAASQSTPAEDGVEGTTENSTTVYYTIFTTFHNEVFYTIGFYYLRPVSEAVQELAVPMLKGFNVAK